ncbi:nuclear transport factor 2 family protein [Photobacterium indicum]|uniref:nuclear transport factor 2 family protein n=1 Tax=Photobacterium indicum TaxID=81447 RepID=UPI003D138B2F
MTMNTQKTLVLDACKQGIERWKIAFNTQNAAGCAAEYEADCVMHARPFGVFTGHEEIQAFWQKIMSDGFCDVDYQDTKWEAKGDNGFILTSSWTMNKAFGVVHREHWLLQADGTAKLHSDDFEVQGER